MHSFWSVYPRMPSNLNESRLAHQNQYYNEIMQKYGILYTKPKSDSKSDDSEEASNVRREEFKHAINESDIQIY